MARDRGCGLRGHGHGHDRGRDRDHRDCAPYDRGRGHAMKNPRIHFQPSI